MKLTWYGHAAFRIETDGSRIIVDPYRSPDCGGYAPIDEPADLVIVSHENDRYHSHLGQIRPPFDVIRGLEVPVEGTAWRGVRIQALHVFETPEKLPGDEVTIIHFRSEGLHVVHLGDLGHALSDEEVASLRGADFVLIPAGGPPTIDFPLIAPLLEAIGPRVVVPMHFLIPGKINLKIQPVERFLEDLPEWPVVKREASSIELTRDSVPASRTIVWLEPAR
jgi:L-ascorbate metabolism protein UlaG (beta-lactamase superfamily)